MITATSQASLLRPPPPRQAFSSSTTTTPSRCTCTEAEGETMTRYACLLPLLLPGHPAPQHSLFASFPHHISPSRSTSTTPSSYPTTNPKPGAATGHSTTHQSLQNIAVKSLKKLGFLNLLLYSLYVTCCSIVSHRATRQCACTALCYCVVQCAPTTLQLA
jgi:hypothetical protein